jgi:hypothetical protein
MIYAYDGGKYDNAPRLGVGADRIDVMVRHEGKTIFPLGATYCGTPSMPGEGWSLDGPKVRALVLSLVAMKPGDTDPDYFASYTEEQIAWAERFGDELTCERMTRYGEDS